MYSKKALTIWELLCVLAVIALLVALIMPSLSRVKSVSTRMVCSSYMRIIGQTGGIYLKDNDELFPDARRWLYSEESISPDHPIGCRWHDQAMAAGGEIMDYTEQYKGAMWAYFEEMSIGTCPEFRDIAPRRGCENPYHNNRMDIKAQYNYSMNGYLGTELQGAVLKLSKVRNPAVVFYFAEENNWSLRPDHPKFAARWLSAPLSTKALDDTALLISPTPEAVNCFATFHGVSSREPDRGYGNTVFIDGHVDSLFADEQLRKNMHGGGNEHHPAGNLYFAWPNEAPPPGGWETQ